MGVHFSVAVLISIVDCSCIGFHLGCNCKCMNICAQHFFTRQTSRNSDLFILEQAFWDTVDINKLSFAFILARGPIFTIFPVRQI